MPGKTEKAVFTTVGLVKLVQACLKARGDEESILSLVWR